MEKIPRVTLPNKDKIIPKATVGSPQKISFSFEALDRNKFFNIDCTCIGWFSSFLERLKSLSSYTVNQLIFNSSPALRFHKVDVEQVPKEVYNPSIGDDIFQFSISKNNGRVHGKIVNDVFYIIWLDPLHNMYPRKGSNRKEIESGKTCCDYNFDIIEDLEKKVKEYEELFDN